MKTQLTQEQSKRLIELGVPKEYVTLLPSSYIDEDPEIIVTVTDLLEILPKNIRDKGYIYDIIMYNELDHWYAGYVTLRPTALVLKDTEELIDSLYKLLLWVIKEKYIKFD